jgi:hypothetical protein
MVQLTPELLETPVRGRGFKPMPLGELLGDEPTLLLFVRPFT